MFNSLSQCPKSQVWKTIVSNGIYCSLSLRALQPGGASGLKQQKYSLDQFQDLADWIHLKLCPASSYIGEGQQAAMSHSTLELKSSPYDQVTNYLDMVIFFLKKLLWGPMKVKFRHLWLRWSWPNVLANLNFWCTIGHPLVAKFSNMCYFHHFLRVRWKRSPQSTGLPWKI